MSREIAKLGIQMPSDGKIKSKQFQEKRGVLELTRWLKGVKYKRWVLEALVVNPGAPPVLEGPSSS